MQITSFPVPAGPGQDEELRRLAVVTAELDGTYEIYRAPRLGPGGKSFFACCDIPDDGSPDPLGDRFRSHRYILEDDVAAKAVAIKLRPCR
jgi:hypothetical protein